MAAKNISVKEFTYKSELVYQNAKINGYLVKTYADGVLIKEQEFGTSVGTEADALSFTKFDTENFGVLSSDLTKYYKLDLNTPLSSSSPADTTSSLSSTSPPQSTYDERPIATGSYRTIKNIKWKMEVYKTPSNKLVFISNAKGERFDPPYSYPLNKTDLEVLDDALAKLNEQYKKPEGPNKPDAVLVSGLDKTHNSSYKSLDEQLLLFKYGFGINKNVKIFRWSVADKPLEAEELFNYLKKYPNTPIFTFSKGCEISGALSSKPYVDVKKLYVLEPYGVYAGAVAKINTALKNGMPVKNIFYGKEKAHGRGIWIDPTTKAELGQFSGPIVNQVIIDGKKYNVGNHWTALINVPKLV